MKDWALLAFAYGYGDVGPLPMPRRAQASARAIAESELTIPELGPLILEAGRTEAHRARREKAHDALYALHAAALGKAWSTVLARIDVDATTKAVIELADQHAKSGSTVQVRRASVAAYVKTVIDGHTHPTDAAEIAGLSAAGWAHATAHGRAEAQSTSEKGGPPDAKLVAAATAAALKLIPERLAAAATEEWGDLQAHTLAMGVAMAAGDGAALGEATRKVASALSDTGRATKTYTDALHRAVNDAYVQSVQAQAPEAKFDFVNGGPDPCDDCIEDALDSPYDADDLPECPEHSGCYCNIEQTDASVMAGAIG